MARSANSSANAEHSDRPPATTGNSSQTRKANRLKDEVYREMLLLETKRPGSEMGLALALLRAMVQSELLWSQGDFREWLKAVCAIGLRMIEASLGESARCNLDVRLR